MGAVLSHVKPDGSEKPVAFASRTLSPPENYLIPLLFLLILLLADGGLAAG